jgi:hypothetical protein
MELRCYAKRVRGGNFLGSPKTILFEVAIFSCSIEYQI